MFYGSQRPEQITSKTHEKYVAKRIFQNS